MSLGGARSRNGGGVQADIDDLDAMLDYIGGQLMTLEAIVPADNGAPDNDQHGPRSGTDLNENEEADDNKSDQLVAFERLSCAATETILTDHSLLLNQMDIDGEQDDTEMDIDGDALPVRVQACMSFLEQRALTVEGIFRKCGLKNRVRALHEKLPQIADETCVHDAADWLKAWTRAAGPMLSTSLLRSLLDTPWDMSKWRALLLLEHGRRRDGKNHVLQRLLLFLNKFAAMADESGMNARNLSICWAPALLPTGSGSGGGTPTELSKGLVAQLADSRAILQTLIEEAPRLFTAPLPVPDSGSMRHGDPISASSKFLIPAAPQDILIRLLYQRHRWDPLVAEWRIISHHDQDGDRQDASDVLALSVAAASGARRDLELRRQWSQAEGEFKLSEICDENGARWSTTWTMNPSVRDARCCVTLMVTATGGGEGLMLLGGRTRGQLLAAFERLIERQLISIQQSFELPALHGSIVRV